MTRVQLNRENKERVKKQVHTRKYWNEKVLNEEGKK